ncbi:hypothetical protein ASE06_16555 [Sphingopyxis sp. Root214]|uniref:DUF4350 domain-containing protein n=1 Tax=unclassified Sphingopyxis TaxID=2614943 RepID=UPI0006F4F187|nr:MULTISPECIES: DUF4350 domain-containing protein [unclassified Sphingopyxis]KQZ74367.1 hypothetical protein ASD73_14210 [Sphingopyxis sp. Root154]KRC08507.1 hypothetical protein ASE06_16555 [Sphingopyxis sp. Root214]
MSDTAATSDGFNPRLIAAVVAIGIVAFVALWALIALGPQVSSGNDGGGHALSKAAPGYAGIVDLVERAGADVDLRRRVETARYEDHQPLLVLTPTHRTRAPEIAELIDAEGSTPVVIVLPKWQTIAIPGQTPKPGWVSAGLPVRPPVKILPPAHFGKVEIKAAPSKAQPLPADIAGHRFTTWLPGNVQTIEGDNLETLIAGPSGGAVLAQVRDRDLYILADPDLINNLAFASREKAVGSAMLVDAIADYADADGLAFDLTLNGFGGQRSLLRFAFVPPFIGITLCLIAAGLLALWQAWTRFGPALNPRRAIPVSKAALIANSADLIRQARRELDGADAFVKSQRIAIARRLHAPGGLDDEATDRWIDKHLGAGSESFSSLARRLPLARNTHEFLEGAQALHDIRKDLLRDS